MEEIFEKFNALVLESADAVAEAKNEKEAEKIQLEYDSKIDSAEKELEEAIEKQFEEDNKTLEAEQKASEQELIDLAKEDDIEVEEEEEEVDKEELIKTLTKNYNRSDHRKVLKEAGIPYTNKMKEAELVELRIENKLY